MELGYDENPYLPKRRQNSTGRPHNKTTVVPSNFKMPKLLKRCLSDGYLDTPLSLLWSRRTPACVPFYFRQNSNKVIWFLLHGTHIAPSPVPKPSVHPWALGKASCVYFSVYAVTPLRLGFMCNLSPYHRHITPSLAYIG